MRKVKYAKRITIGGYDCGVICHNTMRTAIFALIRSRATDMWHAAFGTARIILCFKYKFEQIFKISKTIFSCVINRNTITITTNGYVLSGPISPPPFSPVAGPNSAQLLVGDDIRSERA